MEIKKITPNPYENSLYPAIKFDVEIEYIKYQEAILSVEGWLQSDDKKIIAEVKEIIEPPSAPASPVREIGANNTKFDENRKKDIYKTTLITRLYNRALNYIEERRLENKRHDVVLNLNLRAKYVENKATTCHTYELEPEKIGIKPVPLYVGEREEIDWRFLVYRYNPYFNPSNASRWILSGAGNPVFLAIGERLLTGNTKVEIAASYWIHDYAPVLGLGEYFVIEIPKGEKTIEDAWKYVEKAENSFMNWDLKGVYANCREVGYLLDRIIKEEFGKDSFNYHERWSSAYSRFEHLASLNLHVEELKKKQKYTERDIEIDRRDAEHLLIVTKALIKYAEELLQKPSG